MTLAADEFLRCFLLHVLPSGFRFHRIRHFGFLANGHRTARLTGAVPPSAQYAAADRPAASADPVTGGRPGVCRRAFRSAITLIFTTAEGHIRAMAARHPTGSILTIDPKRWQHDFRRRCRASFRSGYALPA